MKEFLKVAIETAKMAGSVIKDDFYCHKTITKKGKVDFVTQTDKKCEAIIIENIQKSYPEHKFLTEEGSIRDESGGYRWIIDPLDGTTNFIHSFPFVAVSIALEYNNDIIVGVVYNPMLDQLFSAVKGHGAFLNENQINVTNITNIEEALIATGFPYDKYEKRHHLAKVVEQMCANVSGLRRTGSASMDLCYVAAGIFDAYFEEALHPWDIAAGMLIVNEAGGLTSDYKGNPVDFAVCDILASGEPLKKELLLILDRVIN